MRTNTTDTICKGRPRLSDHLETRTPLIGTSAAIEHHSHIMRNKWMAFWRCGKSEAFWLWPRKVSIGSQV